MSKNHQKDKHNHPHNHEQKHHDIEKEDKMSFNDDTLSQSDSDLEASKEEKTKKISKEEQLLNELANLKDSHLRLMAEFDNFRKRTSKEKLELIKNGGEKVLLDLLPVVDDFDLALKNINETTETASVKEGIELIYNKFITFLKKSGLEPIETEGKAFSEDECEAIAMIPAPTEEQKGMIIDCIRRGYKLGDKVVRYAGVIVAN